MRLFDWLRTGSRQTEPPEEWWQRLDRLEHEMKQLQLEWEETYGKVRRALATLAKRQQREAGGDDEPEANHAQPRSGSSDPSAYAALRAMYGRR